MTNHKNKRVLNIVFVSLAAFFLFNFMHFITLPVKTAHADENESESESETIINATVTRPADIIFLSVPETATLNLTPTLGGTMTVVSSDIDVGTSSSNGYRLYLEMTGNDADSNSLINTTSNAEITSNGTFARPAALSNGTWGYAISSSEDVIATPNGFDANYETMQNATPTNSKFAAVPDSSSPAQKIAKSNEMGDDIITVYYGVRTGYETATGTYANTVLYTAFADDPEMTEIDLIPAAIFERGGETLQITTPLHSTTSDIETHTYLLTAAEYAAVTDASNPVPISTYSSKEMTCTRTQSIALQLSCTTFEVPLGEAHVYVDIPHYGQSYSDIIPIKDTTPENMWTLQTLQGFDDWPEFCDNLVTPSASATRDVTSWAEYSAVADKITVVPTHTMIDVRDGEAYQVKKLADGRCWMTENLRLEDATLTSADTNLPAGKTVILPASTTSGWCNGNSAGCYEQLLTMNYTDAGNSSHPEYGSYYNWYTATATYGKRSTTSDTNYSICPAGWHLPKGGPNGEFQALYDAGYNTPALMMKDAGGPHFVLSGAREAGTTEATGQIGRYWSSTPTSNKKQAYRFYVSESEVQPASPNIYGKHRGLSIRCVNDVRN